MWIFMGNLWHFHIFKMWENIIQHPPVDFKLYSYFMGCMKMCSHTHLINIYGMPTVCLESYWVLGKATIFLHWRSPC